MYQTKSKKIHPATSNIIEHHPLDTVKIVNVEINTTSQQSNTITTVTTCCNTTATTAITTASSDISILLQLQHATDVPLQKVVTKTKTLTANSTTPPLPTEVAATQSPNSVNIFDRSKFVQTSQQPAFDVALTAVNEIPQENDSTGATTITDVQHSAVEENTSVDEEQLTIAQIENEAKGISTIFISFLWTTLACYSLSFRSRRYQTIYYYNCHKFRYTAGPVDQHGCATKNATDGRGTEECGKRGIKSIQLSLFSFCFFKKRTI